MSAGTVAVSLLCEQRGWDYEVLRTSDLQDEAEIEQLSLEMFAADAEGTLALDASWKQASYGMCNEMDLLDQLALDPSSLHTCFLQ